MLFLKQSTASQAVLIGPFVDDTDGATAETGLTIANTDIRLSANGGNLAAKNSGGGTHDEAGWYQITLDATDTATVGTLQLHVKVSGALMVHAEFHVLEEAVYDNMFASSAVGPLTAAAVNSEVDTALTDIKLDHLVAVAESDDPADNSIIAKLANSGATADWSAFDNTTDSLMAIRDRGDAAWTTGSGTGLTPLASGTAQGGTSSTIQLAAGETFADSELVGNAVNITGGTGAGQSRSISGYTGATDTAGVTPNWTTTPSSDSTYEVVQGSAIVSTFYSNTLTAAVLAADAVAEIVDGVWDEDATGHQDGGTFGQAIGDPGANTETMYDAVVTDAAGTNVAADVIAVKAETANILTDTAEIGAAGAGLTDLGGMSTTMKGQVNTEMDGALDTAIPGTPTAGSVNDVLADLDGVLPGGTIATLTAANVATEIADALNSDTQTESYATDGSAATIAQLLYMILGCVAEFSISGTTLTVKKLDGSTTAMTYTLDDASDPTSRTRAT